MAAASFRAYSGGHPDAPGSLEEAERRAQQLLAGESGGPVLDPPSAAIMDTSVEAVAGAVVVTPLEAEPWCREGGPWVADIFVVPSHRGRGLGLALLLRAIPWSHAAGEARIGLTVTDAPIIPR